jgi:site-specific recombinase XerD
MSTDPIKVLTDLAASLNASPADLRNVADALSAGVTMPTVAAYAPTVLEAIPAKSCPTYRSHIVRFAEQFADRRLDEVTPREMADFATAARARAAEKRMAMAAKKKKALRQSDVDALGRGAEENCVRALRFFYKTAEMDDLMRHNPARKVPVPKRLPAPERPLTAAELEEFALVACTTGNDTELDGWLFEFHRKTAARREGGLNLRVCDLDPVREAVTITSKFGKTYEVPLDRAAMAGLLAFAEARGATGDDDRVFRSRRGRPMSRKRYETIYDRLDAHTGWSERLDVGIHWVRHTTVDDIRSVADLRVAQAYAGHDDSMSGDIGGYTKVTFDEKRAAYRALFGV